MKYGNKFKKLEIMEIKTTKNVSSESGDLSML